MLDTTVVPIKKKIPSLAVIFRFENPFFHTCASVEKIRKSILVIELSFFFWITHGFLVCKVVFPVPFKFFTVYQRLISSSGQGQLFKVVNINDKHMILNYAQYP